VTARSRRSTVLMLAVVAAAFAVLISLGTWQVNRLAWKQDLIARVEARVDAPAEPLPPPSAWPALEPEAIEYRPVRLAGTFDHEREIHVFISLSTPRGPYGGQGWFVLTPLQIDAGQVVFVNRGFVPADRKDPATRPEGQVEGRVEIEGLMRPAEQANWLSPAPDLARNV
jgi:surfeit locus 1 family protein